MVNPVGQMTAVLPLQSALVLMPDGTMSQEWYQFFQRIFKRTGGASGPSDIGQQAYDLATEAHTLATTAENTASTAIAVANSAYTVANQAITQSNAAAVSTSEMQRAANLSDVSSISTARTNLRVDEVTLYFSAEKATGQALDMPITRNLTIPASLLSTQTYWQPSATDAVIPIQTIKSDGSVVGIGSITLIANSPFGHTYSFFNQAILFPGDVLRLLIPVSTGTGIGISIKSTIN